MAVFNDPPGSDDSDELVVKLVFTNLEWLPWVGSLSSNSGRDTGSDSGDSGRRGTPSSQHRESLGPDLEEQLPRSHADGQVGTENPQGSREQGPQRLRLNL